MKILVTGATGYVGQNLVSKLLNLGHIVHVLCRQKPEGEPFEHNNIVVFSGDLLDRDAIQSAMAGCKQAYHVAAYARAWAKDPKTYFKINVQGTVNILDAALEAGVEKVVYTSTVATLATSNGSPATEDAIRQLDFFTEYESSKFMAEEKVQQYVRRGLHVSMVHPVRVYGPGKWTESNVISMMIKSYVEGNWHVIPGDGNALGCFSYIEDVVNGHLLAMENGKPGEKYILGGVNMNFNQFFNLLKKITNKHFLLIRIPVPLLMLFGWKEEAFSKWFNKEPIITRKWINKYRYNLDYSCEKAIQELGYTVTPIEEGIRKTLEWLETSKKVYF
jgi:farnesol dehydrogenase